MGTLVQLFTVVLLVVVVSSQDHASFSRKLRQMPPPSYRQLEGERKKGHPGDGPPIEPDDKFIHAIRNAFGRQLLAPWRYEAPTEPDPYLMKVLRAINQANSMSMGSGGANRIFFDLFGGGGKGKGGGGGGGGGASSRAERTFGLNQANSASIGGGGGNRIFFDLFGGGGKGKGGGGGGGAGSSRAARTFGLNQANSASIGSGILGALFGGGGSGGGGSGRSSAWRYDPPDDPDSTFIKILRAINQANSMTMGGGNRNLFGLFGGGGKSNGGGGSSRTLGMNQANSASIGAGMYRGGEFSPRAFGVNQANSANIGGLFGGGSGKPGGDGGGLKVAPGAAGGKGAGGKGANQANSASRMMDSVGLEDFLRQLNQANEISILRGDCSGAGHKPWCDKGYRYRIAQAYDMVRQINQANEFTLG